MKILVRVIFFALVLAMSVWASAEMSDAREGVIVYVERRPTPTREGLSRYLGLRDERIQPSSNVYDSFTFNIVAMYPDGRGNLPLTTDGMSERPKWSWDGQWIAYTSGPTPIQSLYVVRADGTDRKELLNRQQAILDYRWSYDNERVLATVETRRGNNILEGQVINVATGDVGRLSRTEWQKGWNHWEPNQEDVANPRARLIEALPGVEWPFWSPDREWLAFIHEGFLARAHTESVSNTGNWFLFRDEPPADRIVQWAWDSRRILFSLNGYLAVAELDGDKWGAVYPVTTRRANGGSFNSASDRVVFHAQPPARRNAQLFVVDIDGENETQITHDTYDHFDPQWQPLLNIDAE